MDYKEVLKRCFMVILVLLKGIMLFFLGVQLFWGLAMGRVEVYPSSPEEDLFIENVEEKNKLAINYNDMRKSSNVRDINIYERGYEHPSITLNKNNVKKFSDSIFTGLMKVYSLKKETDSLFITFSIDSLQDKKTKIYYRIDTSFHYKVK